MIKQLAWNTFKNTGDINAYLELVEVENIERAMKQGNEEPQGKQIPNNLGENIGVDTKKEIY
ncbi:MAG: hypothetical protein ACLU84_07310 [Clostridia bacterium]